MSIEERFTRILVDVYADNTENFVYTSSNFDKKLSSYLAIRFLSGSRFLKLSHEEKLDKVAELFDRYESVQDWATEEISSKNENALAGQLYVSWKVYSSS